MNTQDKVINLGHVRVPTGTLMIIDMGLLNLWRHDKPPGIPEGLFHEEITKAANNGVDFQIDGPDKEEAGRAFARHWYPHCIFDVPEHAVKDMETKFSLFAQEKNLSAHLTPIQPRVTHRKRVDQALEYGDGAGEVFFNGITAVAIDNLPTDRELPVIGRPMEEEFRENLKSVSIEVVENYNGPVTSKLIGYSAVDWARLMITDLEALGKWQHENTLDGKADFVFWGRDAQKIVTKYDANKIDDNQYGWIDLPIDEAVKLGTEIEKEKEETDLKFATDFRPHSHHYLLMAQIRSSDTNSGVLNISDTDKTCAFHTLWGDGFYPVFQETDDKGNLVRVIIELATEQIVSNYRALQKDCS